MQTVIFIDQEIDYLTVCNSRLKIINVMKPTKIKIGSKLHQAKTFPTKSPVSNNIEKKNDIWTTVVTASRDEFIIRENKQSCTL